MAERQQDIETLKRRGRRRLVGAVALVLAAVIVLPMVFDPEPRRGAPPVSVRIPGEDDAPFKPKPVPKSPEKKLEEKKAEQPPAEGKAEKKAGEKAVLSKPAPAKPAPAERARAEAALAGVEYVVQVGAFSNPKDVIAKLEAAKLPYYTEALKDNLTRVRAGPFPTKEAAEKARERLKGLGLEPGTVTTRSG
jgi:DedD protein